MSVDALVRPRDEALLGGRWAASSSMKNLLTVTTCVSLQCEGVGRKVLLSDVDSSRDDILWVDVLHAIITLAVALIAHQVKVGASESPIVAGGRPCDILCGAGVDFHNLLESTSASRLMTYLYHHSRPEDYAGSQETEAREADLFLLGNQMCLHREWSGGAFPCLEDQTRRQPKAPSLQR